jgi:hypothetical protein
VNPFWARVLIALLILIVDTLFFIAPLAALFAGYVLIFRPPWFKEWVDRLYAA